jgi:adenylate cyclase
VSGSEPFRQRLAALLAADVVGYSRLMSMDERATVAALDAARAVFRKQIEVNQGRVIDMAGDSVLAVFETAAGAVGAALAVQATLAETAAGVPQERRMRFRIGVHLGDVIEKADGTVYGDGVNIAARLEGLAEPGGITVSESIRAAVKSKLRAAFHDLGEQLVKNIADPVRAYRVSWGTAEGSPSKYAVADIDLSLPNKPSIAVLPFVNMSGDPEQEYFTDGVTEDIITELSRFKSLFVIARNSTFSYKGKSPDIRQVGKELGVRYVLEGSMRKAANRIRVTAQFVDSLTGNHLWAERYDRDLADVFTIQEDLTRSIVAAIAPEVERAEWTRAERKRSQNLSAYDHALRSRALSAKSAERADRVLREQALGEARAALDIDPTSVEGLIALASALQTQIFFRTASDPNAAWNEAMAATARAIEIDPAGTAAHTARGNLLLYAPDGPQHREALRSLSRALELNPNDATVLHVLGFCEALSGDPASSMRHLNEALRVNPRDPRRPLVQAAMMVAAFSAQDYAATLHWALQSASERPNLVQNHVFAAQAYVGLGEIDRARAALETALKVGPEFVRVRLDGWSVYAKPEDRARQITFLRIAAGLEDPSAADALR